MKRLTCEMCGSTDIMKQDGVFVCQTCGCKYSLEEAKKMMVEGTVEVQGTVKVDNSAFVAKYLANARRARSKEDWEETEKYYNMVEQNDPSNIEAIFYSAFGKAKSSLVENDIYKRQQAFKVLTNCVSIIDDNYTVDKAAENETAIKEMSADILKMRHGSFVYTQWKNGYGIVTRTNEHETVTLFNVLDSQFIESLENIAAKDEQPYLYHLIIAHCESLISHGSLSEGYQSTWRRKKSNAVTKKAELDQKIRDAARREKAKRIEKYWDEHSEEKAALEAELVHVKAQIDATLAEIENIPGKEEIDSCQAQRKAMQEELESLGLFKAKQKKELQAQIDELYKKIRQMGNERQSQQETIRKTVLSPLYVRKKEIENEFAKDRV